MVQRIVLVILATLSASVFALAASQTIPAGTFLMCRLSQTVSTKLNSAGQQFRATVSEPILVNGLSVIPSGASLIGRISRLRAPGRVFRSAEMVLLPEDIAVQDGHVYPLSAVLVTVYGVRGAKVADTEGTLQGPTGSWGQVKEVGLGMGGGGFLGALLGGPHGAILGLALGGAAGFLDRVHRGVPNLSLPQGTELEFQLLQPLTVSTSRVAEYRILSTTR